MKIEIELEEVELLREKVKQLSEQVDRQRKELYEFNQHNLVEKAIRLSQDLTLKCIDKIFTELGFDHTDSHYKCRFSMLDLNGKHWWESENTEIELGATVTTKMKSAFLSIGFRTEELPRHDEIKLPD